MTTIDEDVAEEVALDETVEPRSPAQPVPTFLGMVVRTIARVWVISLLLLAAAFGGIAVNQLFQAKAELAALRKAPGPDAYAVVAYKRELERQIRALDQTARADTVPTPPPRPRLMEDIDLARPRDREPVFRGSSELAPISAPQ
jgi:hypothetical protein